jgi:hypothetical protein
VADPDDSIAVAHPTGSHSRKPRFGNLGRLSIPHINAAQLPDDSSQRQIPKNPGGVIEIRQLLTPGPFAKGLMSSFDTNRQHR